MNWNDNSKMITQKIFNTLFFFLFDDLFFFYQRIGSFRNWINYSSSWWKIVFAYVRPKGRQSFFALYTIFLILILVQKKDLFYVMEGLLYNYFILSYKNAHGATMSNKFSAHLLVPCICRPFLVRLGNVRIKISYDVRFMNNLEYIF